MEFIWSNNPFARHLVLFDHYIDNIIIIWQVDTSSITNFIAYCNNNPFSIRFTSVTKTHWHSCTLNCIMMAHGEILSRTHFKPTLDNSYLPQVSFHLPSVKDNISHPSISLFLPEGKHLKKLCAQETFWIHQYVGRGRMWCGGVVVNSSIFP